MKIGYLRDFETLKETEQLGDLGVDGKKFLPDPDRKLSTNLYDIYHCCVYGEKLLMMSKGIVRNM
jgi:hypothetical protein